MKTYITFGQNHAHRVNGQTFDCNCVAVINAANDAEGRELAFQHFEGKFCFSYTDDHWDESKMHFFPRGYIAMN